MEQKTRGFTVVEVTLVCAIAGLIFVMAFVALPSLWASQRDADRKALVTEFVSAVKKYQTNNSRGALPTGTITTAKTLKDISSDTSQTSWGAFIKNYLPKNYVDPDSAVNKWGEPKDDNKLYVAECGSSLKTGAVCNSTNVFKTKNATDNVSLDKTTYVALTAKCDGNQAVKSVNNRDAAVFYILERGIRYCLDI